MLDCNHMFHRDCLKQYFKTEIKSRKFPIHCPQDKCEHEVIFEDLSEILDKADIDNFWEYTLN